MTVFDLDELALKNRRLTALSALRYRKSDRLQWTLRFLQDESFVELPADAALSVAIKRTRSSSSYLALATSPAKTGTGSTAIYTFDLNLNTEPVSYELSDKESIECVLEVEVVTSTQRLTSQSVPLTIERDIIDGDPPPVTLPDLKATQQDAEAGTDNAKWMTPLRTVQAIAAWFSGSFSVAWASITGKPETFPPSTHTHDQADVNGLAAALAAKLTTGDVPALQFQRTGDALTFNQYGSILQQLVGAADSRLTDARQPTPHAATHGANGSDPLVFTAASPLLLASSDGAVWEVTISNSGTLVREKLPA